MILNSPYISGSLIVTSNGTISGSLTVLGGITGAITGSATSASYAISASEASTLQGLGSASFAPASTFNTVSQSYAVASASLSTRVTTNETNISTLTAASSSFATMSGSLSTRVTNLEATSSTVSQSFASTSGSISGRVTLIEGQYATTGSNNFTAPQQISDASNAISFTSTASLYTDGGLRVGKSAFISGTAYFNDVVVYGTSSIEYITSSQVNIGSNIITVNTDTPAVRFGGLSVFDSGSTQLTGSMFWDSEKNNWIYSNPSGSTYNSGMLISGPRNSGSLGSEEGTTGCALMMGQGGDHITSSAIFSYGNATCFYGNAKIDSTGSACFANTVCTPSLLINNLTNITPNSDGVGQVVVQGSGYIGYIAMDSTAMNFGHNSQIRNLTLQTNEANRLSLDGDGVACFACTVCAPTISSVKGLFSGCIGINNPTPAWALDICGSIFTRTAYQGGTLLNTASCYGIIVPAAYLPNPGAIGHILATTEGSTANMALLSIDDGGGGAQGFAVATGDNSSISLRMCIASSGITTFACRICAPSLTITGDSLFCSAGSTAITLEGTTPIINLTRNNNASSPAAQLNFKTSQGTVRWQIATNSSTGTGLEINQGDGTNRVFYIDTSGRLSLSCYLFANGGGIAMDLNATDTKITNYGYGGGIVLRRSDADSNRYGRFGIVDSGINWVGGMQVNNDTSATFSSTICAPLVTVNAAVRLYGSASGIGCAYIVTATGANEQPAIILEKAGGYGNSEIRTYYNSLPDYGLAFRVGSTTAMYINSNGAVAITSPAAGTTPFYVNQNQSANGYLQVNGDQRIGAGSSVMFEYIGSVPAAGNACVLVIPTLSQGNLHTRATFEIHGVSAEYNGNGFTGAFGGVVAIEYLNNVNVVQGYNFYGTLCGVSSSGNCVRLSFNRSYNSGAGDYEGITLRIKLLTTLGWPNYFNCMTMQ